MASRWGDWHLACSLARALERLGHVGLVRTVERADEEAARTCDVRIVLRGLVPWKKRPGQTLVLWIISHPELVDDAECDDADLVLVASERFATYLRGRTSTPVEVFLQATDQHRFHPLAPSDALAHPVVVVAKSRDVARPVVMDAIAAGLEPAIFGSGWREFVDPRLIVEDYVANDDLPLVYASAGVVLNDHWDWMRDRGFVSNRIFDVLACGTPIISDHLPEIETLFGDAVGMYRDASDLRELVEERLRDPVAARARVAEAGELVRSEHTLDARARRLLELMTEYRLAPPGS
jgi:hypothetical protein